MSAKCPRKCKYMHSELNGNMTTDKYKIVSDYCVKYGCFLIDDIPDKECDERHDGEAKRIS